MGSSGVVDPARSFATGPAAVWAAAPVLTVTRMGSTVDRSPRTTVLLMQNDTDREYEMTDWLPETALDAKHYDYDG